MFEDKHIFKFVCILLGVFSIFLPGPIIPIISFIIGIGMLIYKIKCVKESPEGFEALMIDIILIIIVIVIDIGFFAMRISIESEYDKYNYSSSSSQKYTIEELAESTISVYKMGHLSQFTDKANNLNKIKKEFKVFLEEEVGLTDFTVNKNDITYTIK